MGADLSGVRFDALRDYSGVVMQQGRVLLDADWNELVAVLDRRLRANAADLGSTGPTPGVAGVAVVPRTTPQAFAIEATGGTLTIGVGRMYVDGLLAENHGLPAESFDPLLGEPVGTTKTPYDEQPYWKTAAVLPESGSHLAYLDVWDREVTPLEAPDLVEPAVGVDTTVRTQTVWQVRVLADSASGVTCTTPDEDVPGWLDVTAPSAGRLTTGTVPVDDEDDPCELPPTGGYRGLENQTYRVEIHDGGAAGTATFKWSRDNGSVASPVVEVVSTTRVRPASLGKDSVLRFRTGDWVEILDDHRELDQRPGEMRRIEVHEEDGTISWTGALPSDLQMTTDEAGTRHLRVRRWDQSGKVLTTAGATVVDLDQPGATGLVPIAGTSPTIVLEHGVTVRLRAPGGAFRSGDYWIFTARTATSDVERLVDAPPLGIHHHYARLAVVTFPGSESDCRTLWPPTWAGASETCGDCTACVTPESHASGAMTVQAAIDLVRPTGGTVCLAPGVYHLNEDGVRVDGATSLTLRGQGARSLLVARGQGVQVTRSAFVRLEDFCVVSAGGQPAVRLDTTVEVGATRLTVLVAAPQDAPQPGFALSGVSLLTRLRDNVVVAPVGVTGGQAEGAALLTASLEVTGSLLVCPLAGVSFDGRVAHLLGNTVSGNTVLRATDAGVRSLGLVGPGGSFDVVANELLVDGTGVEVATAGFAVHDNGVTGTEQSLERRSDGVAVQKGSFGAGRGPVRVTGNRLRDLGGTGVAVRAAVGDLHVADNLVERVQRGIVMEERGRALTAAVEGNVIRDVGNRAVEEAGRVAGIQVVGVGHASVRDNTVHDLATAREVAGSEAAAVRVLATRDSHVVGNSVDVVGFDEAPGPGVGVQVAGSFERTLVQGNHSRRSPADVDELAPAAWTGLQVGIRPELEGGVTVVPLASFVEVAAGTSSYLLGGKAAFAVAPRNPTATVDTNTVTGGGDAPAALVSVSGDLVVSGNHCRQPRETRTPALELYARTATVSANRAVGGRPSIAAQVPPERLAVLGNLTSSGIDVPGGLDPTWVPLNPDGIF